MNDEFGERLKSQYEDRTRYCLPRRTYTIIRLDGKAFHTYTRGLNKPFDEGLYEDIDNSIIAMMSEVQGVVFAYTQSDEISLLLTDFAKSGTSAWFDGNIQKMVSVSSSVLTAHFNRFRSDRQIEMAINGEMEMSESDVWPLAYFDSRTFTIPDRTEVMNYFRWRQQDCIRNSVSMVAQSEFSHKQLHGKSQSHMHDMLHEIGVNWATDLTDGQKNGRLIVKENYIIQNRDGVDTNRSRWVSKGAWVFTKDEGKLLDMIPKYE